MEGKRGARARWAAFLVGATARRLAVEAAPMAGDRRKEQGKKRKGKKTGDEWVPHRSERKGRERRALKAKAATAPS